MNSRHSNPLACLPFLMLFLAMLSLGLVSCNDQTASKLPTVAMPIGKLNFTLEIAAGGAARERGLMMRDSMPADHGMVFCFAKDRQLQFWMHNTRIPLDILYVDSSGKIVSIHALEPYVEDSVPAAGPAKYAIELNRDMASKAGVKAGDMLRLPGEITSAKAEP